MWVNSLCTLLSQWDNKAAGVHRVDRMQTEVDDETEALLAHSQHPTHKIIECPPLDTCAESWGTAMPLNSFQIQTDFIPACKIFPLSFQQCKCYYTKQSSDFSQITNQVTFSAALYNADPSWSLLRGRSETCSTQESSQRCKPCSLLTGRFPLIEF